MNLVSPEGLGMVRLGGDDVWKQRLTKGIVSEYKWIDGKCSMILYRPVAAHRTKAFVIDLRDAHHYAESNGGPSPTLMRDAMTAAEEIGFSARDKSAVMAIMDVILDGLSDLLKMPPEPTKKVDTSREPDGVFTISGKEIPVWQS